MPKTRARPEGLKTLDCCCVADPDEPGVRLRGCQPLVGADFFERENSEIVDEGGLRAANPDQDFLSGYQRSPAEEHCHVLPREAIAAPKSGDLAAPKSGDGPTPRGSTGASPLREAHGESNSASGLRDQKADRDSAARGRRGPESIPGRSPKRSGPSRTMRPGGRVWPRSRSSRDLRRDRMWRRLRERPESFAFGLSLIRSEERVSRAALLHPVGGGHVGALRGGPQGPSVQRWPGQLCLGVTCRSRAGSRLSPGVTAEAGRIRDVSESSGASPKRGSRQSPGSNAELVGVPLA